MAYIYGMHAVLALLKNSPHKADQLYFLDKHTHKTNPVYLEIKTLMQSHGISSGLKTKKELDNFATGGNHQGPLRRLARLCQERERPVLSLQS